jgi:hypothetical protein
VNGGQLAIDRFVHHDGSGRHLPLVIIEAFNPNGAGAAALAEAIFAVRQIKRLDLINDTKKDDEGKRKEEDLSSSGSSSGGGMKSASSLRYYRHPSMIDPPVGLNQLEGYHDPHVNYWGKLPYTLYPHKYIEMQHMNNFDMAKSPGRTYKYYDNSAGEVLFPFGYGLSLTKFELTCSLNVNDNNHHSATEKMKKDVFAHVGCKVTNMGKFFYGDEVIMVYHSVGDDIRSQVMTHPIPIKQLIEFQRVRVPPGQQTSNEIHFYFTRSHFKLIDENGKDKVYAGTHSLIFTNGNENIVELKFDM